MILHSVHVENYKGIRGPWDVEFNVESPNLLEGPNGVGKSTLVDAIQRCLVESHNVSGAGAEEMRPRGTALTPAIELPSAMPASTISRLQGLPGLSNGGAGA